MSEVPAHIAIIMDGNGRWAESNGLKRTQGHEKGAETTRKIVESSIKLGVKHLTIYAFSSENWQRPQEEVGFLMKLLTMQIRAQLKDLHKNGVKLLVIGDRSKLSDEIRGEVEKAEQLTSKNANLTLQVALSYGSRQEILDAVEQSGGDIEKFEQGLQTNGVPDPDLLIRTGGEKRISNFLLWQIAYTELYFTDTPWPEFSEDDFLAAIKDFNSRDRRFGKTKAA